MVGRIAIGADHGGFRLKNSLVEKLKKWGYGVYDVGTHSEDACDYPEAGFECALRVSRKKEPRGILICRTGIGMAVIANKLSGVRAGVCSGVSEAISAREHNDINVLVLAADVISEKDSEKIVKAWLRTPALKGRHARRVRLIKDYEKKVFKKT
jgi:ribose 5-phosphate isomerase B